MSHEERTVFVVYLFVVSGFFAVIARWVVKPTLVEEAWHLSRFVLSWAILRLIILIIQINDCWKKEIKTRSVSV